MSECASKSECSYTNEQLCNRTVTQTYALPRLLYVFTYSGWYRVPIGRYEQFHETGKPVRERRPVITSPIYRTFVDEAIAGYDIKDDVARDLYIMLYVRRVILGIVKQTTTRWCDERRVKWCESDFTLSPPLFSFWFFSPSRCLLRCSFMNALRISSHRPVIDLSRVSILQNGY